jgi:hypothetical protein
MTLLKNVCLVLAVVVTSLSMMDIILILIQTPLNKMSDLNEFSKPFTVFLYIYIQHIFVFLLALDLLDASTQHSAIYNHIISLVWFSLISIYYFMGIFLLAISSDSMFVEMMKKNPFQSRSFFSPQAMVLSPNVKDSREVLLTYFVVMFSIMSTGTMSATAYYFMMEKKKPSSARTMQILV